MQSPSRRNMFHIELDCAVPMSPLLPCSGVHHRAGVRGRQPADPAGGAAVQRAGLDVLALRRCPAAPWPGLPLLCCRVHVQRQPSPGSALVIYVHLLQSAANTDSHPDCCLPQCSTSLSGATSLAAGCLSASSARWCSRSSSSRRSQVRGPPRRRINLEWPAVVGV